MTEIFFEETQSFRQPQLWIPMLSLFILVVGFQSYGLAAAEDGGTARWIALGLFVGIYAAVMILLYLSRLDVTVSSDGLLTRFFPLEIHFRKTEWKDISSCKIETVEPRRYGGWGLRLAPGRKAYLVSGKQAMVIKLTDGRTLLVGTREPERFLEAMRRGGEDRQS
jgi:hypothetical protein